MFMEAFLNLDRKKVVLPYSICMHTMIKRLKWSEKFTRVERFCIKQALKKLRRKLLQDPKPHARHQMSITWTLFNKHIELDLEGDSIVICLYTTPF